MAAFSFFKKKKDDSAASGELKINIPGMETLQVVKKPPAPPITPVTKTKVQRSCDEIYASQHNMLICPHCETLVTNEQHHCPACGLHF